MIDMVRILLTVCSFLALFCSPAPARSSDMQNLTLSIPESVLAEAVQKSLPFLLDTGSDSVEGSISIQRIDDLQLADRQISGTVTLIGNDIQISTAIAGQRLRLKLGTVQLSFNLVAESRYDDVSRTLFIKPTVTDLQSEKGQAGDELGNLLVGLFNGKEFPLTIDTLQPIIADTGSKKLAIGMQIKNISITENMLSLDLLPDIRSVGTTDKKP